ncbi:hypothetical protein Q8A67_008897 [Cirrhinus molitorella]|uniref:Ig-like domain-containing protein n=1 Tax=Cirrhinus molitorella TaxID=172907 RepID=A0AA88PVA5_9TELE|nr:hypothetical protein Q8A67_008897 [Cirrhinus molitorella]
MGTGLVAGDSIEPDKGTEKTSKETETVKLSCSYSAMAADQIGPNKGANVISTEGESVTLSCSYDTSSRYVTLYCYSSADYLYWYRQYPRAAPEFLELILDGTKSAKNSDVDPRLSIKLTKREQKHVDLIISSAAVSDSALYYCALRPTVTGNTQALYKNPLLNERKSENRAHTYPGSAPEFIVLILDSEKQAQESNVDSRFSTKVTKDKENHVDLEISSAAVSDSALYYCALQPTVTGNTKTMYKNLT